VVIRRFNSIERWDIISTNFPKVKSTNHNGSSGGLILLISVEVPEKLPGQKDVKKKMNMREKKKKKNMIFWGIFDVFSF